IPAARSVPQSQSKPADGDGVPRHTAGTGVQRYRFGGRSVKPAMHPNGEPTWRCRTIEAARSGARAMTTALDGHITVDEQGIARVAGTRMKVIHLVMDKMAHNASPEEMQREFPHLTLAQVYAALTYYHDHKPELDAHIAQ